jgi:ADP-ribosylglycohydrolase
MDKSKIILNTFLAGWCADAIGARLEFRNKKIDLNDVIDAIHFRGNNSSGANPGQYTDDSEMELCLLMGLIDGKNEEFFPIEHIALRYIEWFNSFPFDIGMTTRNALMGSKNAEDMVNNAFEFNEYSESNGSLMRCIPIAVYCIGKPIDIILGMTESDASLTHYSKDTQLVTGAYCFIISQILYHRISNITIDVLNLLEETKNIISKNEKILSWFTEAMQLTNLNSYDSVKNEGHVKHAFIFVIYFVKNIHCYNYMSSMQIVLMCGGDTDTNAKIVGNLFGAFYNNCVPENILNVVLNFDCTKAEAPFKRPHIYSINNALQLITHI